MPINQIHRSTQDEAEYVRRKLIEFNSDKVLSGTYRKQTLLFQEGSNKPREVKIA